MDKKRLWNHELHPRNLSETAPDYVLQSCTCKFFALHGRGAAIKHIIEIESAKVVISNVPALHIVRVERHNRSKLT